MKCPICNGPVNENTRICKSCGNFVARSDSAVKYEVDDLEQVDDNIEFEPVKLCDNCNSVNKITAIICKTCGESLKNSKVINDESEIHIDIERCEKYGWVDRFLCNKVFKSMVFKKSMLVLAVVILIVYIINYVRPVINFEGNNYRRIHADDNIEEYRNRRIGRNIKIVDKGDYKDIIISDIGTYSVFKDKDKIIQPNGKVITEDPGMRFKKTPSGVEISQSNYWELKRLVREYGYEKTNGEVWLFIVGIVIILFGLIEIKYPELLFHMRYSLYADNAEPSYFYLETSKVVGLIWIVLGIGVIIFSYGEFLI